MFLRRKRLGDADEGHVLRIASGIARRAINAGAHQGEAVEDASARFFALLQRFGP